MGGISGEGEEQKVPCVGVEGHVRMGLVGLFGCVGAFLCRRGVLVGGFLERFGVLEGRKREHAKFYQQNMGNR